MADESKILTPQQESFLGLIGEEKSFKDLFYLTGGTPLSAFYLFEGYPKN